MSKMWLGEQFSLRRWSASLRRGLLRPASWTQLLRARFPAFVAILILGVWYFATRDKVDGPDALADVPQLADASHALSSEGNSLHPTAMLAGDGVQVRAILREITPAATSSDDAAHAVVGPNGDLSHLSATPGVVLASPKARTQLGTVATIEQNLRLDGGRERVNLLLKLTPQLERLANGKKILVLAESIRIQRRSRTWFWEEESLQTLLDLELDHWSREGTSQRLTFAVQDRQFELEIQVAAAPDAS